MTAVFKRAINSSEERGDHTNRSEEVQYMTTGKKMAVVLVLKKEVYSGAPFFYICGKVSDKKTKNKSTECSTEAR